VDGPTTLLLVLAAFPIFGLGAGLLVSRTRMTAAFNECYVRPARAIDLGVSLVT